jgi:hypothetical protein
MVSAAMLRTKPNAVFLISPRRAGCVENPLSVAMVDQALGRGKAPHSSTAIRSFLAG